MLLTRSSPSFAVHVWHGKGRRASWQRMEWPAGGSSCLSIEYIEHLNSLWVCLLDVSAYCLLKCLVLKCRGSSLSQLGSHRAMISGLQNFGVSAQGHCRFDQKQAAEWCCFWWALEWGQADNESFPMLIAVNQVKWFCIQWIYMMDLRFPQILYLVNCPCHADAQRSNQTGPHIELQGPPGHATHQGKPQQEEG